MFCKIYLCVFFFFKQKTAYEMRISDWSSDVCSSDLNVVERVMILAPSDRLARIDADMLPAELVRGGTDILPHAESITAIPLKEARENFEREYLRIQINRFSGNISRTATFIGMERSALHRKLKLQPGRRKRRET